MELQAILAQLVLLVPLGQLALLDHKEKLVLLAILDHKDLKDQLVPLENLTKPQLQLFMKPQPHSFTKLHLQSFTKPQLSTKHLL